MAVTKSRKAYQADKMVGELARLHDRFYPQPIALQKREGGKAGVSDRDIDHLDKAALLALYRKCGNVLHRGTPEGFMAGETVETDWMRFVFDQAQRISNLLSQHAVIMKGDVKAVFGNLYSGEMMIANAI